MAQEVAVGVIDTVSAAFKLVAGKPALMLIPVVLNVFLWLGPQLSPQPIVTQFIRDLERLTFSLVQMEASQATIDSAVATVSALRGSGLGDANLFGLMVWSSLGMPGISAAAPVLQGGRAVFYVREVWQLAMLNLVLLALGLLLTATFLNLVGNQVRSEAMDLERLAGWTLSTWLRLAAVVIPIGLTMGAILFAAVLFGPFAVIPLVGLVWLLLHISFFPQAITLAGQSPLKAVLSSAQIVRLNLWPTIGLLFLVFVIGNGLGLIWERVAIHSAFGAVLAIGASAYVGTALTAAMFLFYRDRLLRLRDLLSKQRTT